MRFRFGWLILHIKSNVMKRGFLGNAEVSTYQYWSEGKNSHELKCNETILYAEIDLLQSQAQYCKKSDELQKLYSKMDEMYICIKAVEMCGADDDLLRCAGAIIGNMKKEGCFSKRFDNLDDENRYLDGLIEELRQSLSPETETEVPVTNASFDDWFEENVVEYNYYNSPSGKSKTKPLGSLGATTGNDSFSSQMKDSALSLLYYGANQDNVLEGCRDEDEMVAKMYTQGQTIAWFSASGTNMTEKSIKTTIRSGIIDKTGGLSQDQAIDSFRNECVGVSGLGRLGWVQLVIAIASAVSAIITLITQIIANKRSVIDNLSLLDYDDECPYSQWASPENDDYIRQAREEIQKQLDQASGMSTTELLAVLGIAGAGIIGSLAMRKNRRNNEE